MKDLLIEEIKDNIKKISKETNNFMINLHKQDDNHIIHFRNYSWINELYNKENNKIYQKKTEE